jgi:hypothetical protein
MVLKPYKNCLKDLRFFYFDSRDFFLFFGAGLGRFSRAGLERFSRMPHGATRHCDAHRMPGHAP